MRVAPCFGLVAVLMFAACEEATEPPLSTTSRFDDVTATHVPAAPELHALDVAFVDVDEDGDRDVVLAVEYDTNRLYLNDGAGRLTWSEGVFGDSTHDTEHVRAADFNRDGHADIVFVAEDDHVHQLYLGNGDGTFTDATSQLPAQSEGNGLAVGDVDGNGTPDIVVGNSGAQGQDFLWLNQPEQTPLFRDVTATQMPQLSDATQDATLVDVDGDGDLDLVLGNEVPPNRLLLNDGAGTFNEASDRLDLPVPLETRQVLAFDATGDGHPDLVFCNLTSNNAGFDKNPQTRILVNDGAGRFTDETNARMPTNRFSTYACAHVDADGNGTQDLVLSAVDIPGFAPLQVRLYSNDGTGVFQDVTAEMIPESTVGRTWGIAVGDLNGDSLPDLFIGGWGTQARLLLGQR